MDLILLILIILLPVISNVLINSTYSNYSQIRNEANISGKDVARKILDSNGLKDVKIREISGNLTDHYDPRNKTVSLSSDIYDGCSISSVSVAAHECGHAIQDKEGYSPMRLRSKLIPIVNFSSRFATLFIFFGLVSEILDLYYIGIGLLLVGLLFQFVTLPVEFDASRRAMKELKSLNLVRDDELSGSSKVLKAAAFTYIASFLAMLFQIVRLIYNTRDN